jgi:hypothetical protein
VSALILDAGSFIAVERGDRAMLALLAVAHANGIDLRSNAAIVGQVWRGGSRSAALARMLRAVDVHDVDLLAGKAAGELLARAATEDVVDAGCVLLARSGDGIVTSDPIDLRRLVVAAGRSNVAIIPC